jgi:UDP-N-acetylglucosamine--N-acetylmuramyl-(pentapeptide) pyrophosphoryl-undecaprenol N-acetylglucosamine transferase
VRKVLVCVSGTGGHVYPGIALAEELRARRSDVRIVFATARGKPGAEWIERAGFEVRAVPVRGLARRPSPGWLAFPFALAAGAWASFALLASWRPDLVVGTGGYVSGPFVVAAAILRVPVVLLEQNAIPGVTTRVGSLFAREVHLADPASRASLWRKAPARLSGNPVRRSVEHGDGGAFRAAFGVPEDAPLVVVIGGSQGARALTEASIDAVRALGDASLVRWIVQTGARGLDEARARSAGAPAALALAPFLDDVGGAYAAADLVVARAGAMTLAELAASGVPSVLVPYPWAAADHQTKNARRFAAGGAATVIPQSELTGAGLASLVAELLSDRERLARMAEAARRADEAGARARIADACERLLG